MLKASIASLVAFLSLTCAPVRAVTRELTKLPECRTLCGMRAHVTEDRCAALQMTEMRVLAKFDKYVADYTFSGACFVLDDVTVQVHEFTDLDKKKCPLGGFRTEEQGYAFCASGETHPKTQTLELDSDQFETNALAHEMGHLIFGVGHCHWEKRGIKKAIKEITGQKDETADACD